MRRLWRRHLLVVLPVVAPIPSIPKKKIGIADGLSSVRAGTKKRKEKKRDRWSTASTRAFQRCAVHGRRMAVRMCAWSVRMSICDLSDDNVPVVLEVARHLLVLRLERLTMAAPVHRYMDAYGRR